VAVAGDQELSGDLAAQLDHPQVTRVELDDLQRRDHEPAGVEVVRGHAHHPPRIDEQPEERAVLRVEPADREILDVAEPAVAPLLELAARALVEPVIGLGKLRRRDPHQLVRLAVRGVERLDAPAEMKLERMPLTTPPADVAARHEQRIGELLRAHPERQPRTYESFEDVLASMARAHIVLARHRLQVGGLSRDELERFKGRPLSEVEEAFLREVQGKGEPQT
jgi:hypothetical protein